MRPAIIMPAVDSSSWLFRSLALLLPLLTCLCPVAAQTTPDLTWTTQPRFRSAPLNVRSHGQAGFTLLEASVTGITSTNLLTNERVARNRLLEIGSGVALGDVDGDGRVDVYFCRLDGGNVLYRNLGGWRFQDISSTSGATCQGQFSTGAVLVDSDGDGDLDLLVNSLGGGTRLFLNDGLAHFTERTDTRLSRQSGATSMALADVDGDGDLDLYVTNYRMDTFHDHPPGLRLETRRQPDGSTVIEPRDRFVTLTTRNGGLEALERGEGDHLYINQGGGNFAPARWDVGVFLDEDQKPLEGPTTDWGLAVMFRDLNGDGLPDLYVCNDFVFWPDRIWLNQSGKRFQAAPRLSLRNVSLSSMSMDVADINRDGHDDLFVADMLSPRREHRAWQRPDTLSSSITWPIQNPQFRPEVTHNTLHLGRGDGTFAQIASFAGLAATDWTWSSSFLDVDLDGWEDLLVTTGSNHDVQDLDALATMARSGGWKTYESRLNNLSRLPRRPTPSMAFRNRRDLSFQDNSTAWGFDAVGVAQGMAMADLDNDGDLDVVVNCMNQPARVYRNNSPAPRIAVRLKGLGENTRGVGAKIRVLGGPVTQSQEMISGGRYCSSDDAMRVFATGQAKSLRIDVSWRDGTRSTIPDAAPNHVYEIAQTETSPHSSPPPPAPALFQDLTSTLAHTHTKVPFNDFQRQPLLPRKLSTLGPGIACADLNGDGHDDLVIPGGKGDRTQIYLGNGQGAFQPFKHPDLPPTNDRDTTTALIVPGSQRSSTLVEGLANWEESSPASPTFRITQFTTNSNPAPKPAPPFPPVAWESLSSTGPLAMADVDGDGVLDLFIGSRVVPGQYPSTSPSILLHSKQANPPSKPSLPSTGLVSGAVFSDLDADGDPDLVLACEWGPIRVFQNHLGTFTDITTQLGLDAWPGFWNGVAVGDFDGDGNMDIVASNWGSNWRTDVFGTTNHVVTLRYGDLIPDSPTACFMASMDPFLSKLTPWRDMKALETLIPHLRERVPNYHAYGRMSLDELLGPEGRNLKSLQAHHFESTVFLNRSNHFQARPLPAQAQFAPAFGLAVADFDGDGHEDVFLAQNFFGVDPDSSRQDAGTGLLLRGLGDGSFQPSDPAPTHSGLALYAEQRGAAVTDFDEDGRPDLVVGQHNAPTGLFRNQSAKPGVRIRVVGSDSNPGAIGAVLRLTCADKAGPARELHLGSGYWSQDSLVTILPSPAVPQSLSVRWPGGKMSQFPWPLDAREVEVSTNRITKVR